MIESSTIFSVRTKGTGKSNGGVTMSKVVVGRELDNDETN